MKRTPGGGHEVVGDKIEFGVDGLGEKQSVDSEYLSRSFLRSRVAYL